MSNCNKVSGKSSGKKYNLSKKMMRGDWRKGYVSIFGKISRKGAVGAKYSWHIQGSIMRPV